MSKKEHKNIVSSNSFQNVIQFTSLLSYVIVSRSFFRDTEKEMKNI